MRLEKLPYRIKFFAVLIISAILIAGCSRGLTSGLTIGQLTRKPVKAVVVTGGHDFEKESFFKMFDRISGVNYVHFDLKDESEVFENIDDWNYDVIVLYNMTQKISDKRKENFLRLLNEKAVGLVALHHSIANFQDWPEYRKIIGAKYFLADDLDNGQPVKRGAYRENVKINVFVVNKKHPVTRGLDDFSIIDETYKNYLLEPDNKVLLTTDSDDNEKSICWVRGFSKSRVCYIQLGHGKTAFENDNFRTLLTNAIHWTAERNIK